MDKRLLCEQDLVSEVQLEQDMDKQIHQFNSVDVPLIAKQEELVEMINSCQVIKPKKILVVDDQFFNIQALTVILKYSIGISSNLIVSALNGHEAL